MQRIHYRTMAPDDADEVHRLGRITEMFRTAPAPCQPTDAIRRWAMDPDGIAYVATDEKTSIAGFLLGYEIRRRDGHINHLFVEPRRRRQGIGSRLFGMTLEDMRGRGLEQVFVNMPVAAPAYRRLIERHGFERIKTLNVWQRRL